MKFDPEVNPILEKISSIISPNETRDFAFEQGILFYHRKKFFETHEIFEFQWKKEKDELKLFLQALIQISIAMNKVFINPNLVGAKSQSEKAVSKLKELLNKNFFTTEGTLLINQFILNLENLIFKLNSNLELNDFQEPNFGFNYKQIINNFYLN